MLLNYRLLFGGMASNTPPQDPSNDASLWAAFKRDKAHRFVELGYSVQWRPDRSPLMDVYVPAWTGLPIEYRALLLCTLQPSAESLDGGHLMNMRLLETRLADPDNSGVGGLEQRTLFSYSNGESTFLYSPRHRKSVHELNPISMALYHDVRMAFGPEGVDEWQGYRL